MPGIWAWLFINNKNDMIISVSKEKQKLLYLLSSFFIFWMGMATTICYEMGKNGLENLDWGFIFRNNIPVLIISFTLLISALNLKNQENDIH